MSHVSTEVSLASSYLSGILHVFVGYPFDTIKTLRQSGTQQIPKSMSMTRLYSGVKYPLIQNSLINSTCFGLNNYFMNRVENKHFATFLTSLSCTMILAPFDKMKIMNQYNMKPKLNLNIIKKSYRNIHVISACEIPATFFYFSIYRELKDRNLPIFLCGGFAGIGSWVFTYPMDTVKTRIQNESCKTVKEALKKGGLYNGLFVCICRSFLVNGLNFYSYEYFVRLFSN